MILFTKTTQHPPISIGRLSVTFATQDAVLPIEGAFTFQILDDGGKAIDAKSGDLVQYMTATQLTAVTNFLTALRTKANAEAV